MPTLTTVGVAMTDVIFQAVWSLGPVSHHLNLRDLDVVDTGSGFALYGTNGSSGGLISYQINGSTGGLSLADSVLLAPLGSVDGPAHLQQMTISGQAFIVNMGRFAEGLTAIQVGAGADLDTQLSLGGTNGAQISTMVFHTSDTRDLVYTGYWGRSDLGFYEVTPGGDFSYIGQVNSPMEIHGADLVDLRMADVSGQDVLVYASRYQDQIISYTVNANGGLAVADVLSMSDGLPINTPSALEIATVGGQTYAVLAASGTSSLSVMEISASGQLIPTDHVTASTYTRIENLEALDIAMVGPRAFVVAGGANDGVSLFELMPDGRLHHWDAQEDLSAASLQNVTGITAAARANGLDIYASSETEAGITQLRVELGTTGAMVRGDAGDNALSGTVGLDAADVLYGGAGDDTLSGLDGDDVLIGGTGFNLLIGGDGADTFIMSPGATHDSIADFELGVDRIDLSGFGRIYEIGALHWTERSQGAEISFGDRVLIIDTQNNTPLSTDDFTYQDLFNLSHTDLSYMQGGLDPGGDFSDPGNFEGSAGADTLEGMQGDDVIRGNLGDDVIYGMDGDDILNGGAGADILDGGSGSDWVSYEGSRGSLRIDLMFPQINTNIGTGDAYVSIENLIGSQGFDNLRGTLDANVIRGEANVDYIFGRRGDDTLEGGIGDDVLFGGVGADALIGGANRDRAQYSEALTAVEVDLAHPHMNTGEAAGDSFDSIEDLAGGFFADVLSGNSGVNRLFGREGEDTLNGREGNDYLNGGANADILDGGAGNDVLRGGQSFDTFVFREGLDTIEDFNITQDTLLLDAGLLGGGAITAQRALEFASVISGDVVFEFDTGDSLVLENVSTLAVLEDDIIFG